VPFSETILNRTGERADDILSLICEDVANYGGFSLHVNYNLLGKITETHHVPFENCRLCEPNEDGIIERVAIHPDWTGNLKRAGKPVKVAKENIDYINIFNPLTVLDEINEAGGIQNYKGQVLWISSAGKQTYPTPKHDVLISQMSTEEALATISNRNARNNFLPSGVVMVKKGNNTPDISNEGVEQYEPSESISQAIGKMQTDENTGNIAVYEYEFDEDILKFINIKGNNYDKDFSETTKVTEAKIHAVFNQEVFYRIKSGSLGFSTEIMQQAYEYYSTVTNRPRRMIERAFDKIMKYFVVEVATKDFTINPLQYISSDNDKGSIPLAVSLGVGGTQSLQSIISDVNIGNEQKVIILQELFNFDEETAKAMIFGSGN
jgi:hypothetical protein